MPLLRCFLEARSAPIHPMTVEVFPNPVRSNLNIKLHDNVDHQGWLELTNINGQIQSTWKNIPLHESMSLNVEQLSSGVYFLRINTWP
ncbi:MAG: T9SS type A sorting domain-containing protein [Saprospiraceae bacterium]|nr:T9SS type A sorting domain-containing protein [Saprospiraceae bacterium]